MKQTPTFLHKLYTVSAGFSTFGRDQNRFVQLDLNRMMIPNPQSTILCEVQGESMIGAGIYPGDTLLVDRNYPATPGSIVVAEIDGGRTVRCLQIDAHGVKCLQGANESDPGLIYPQESMSIFGVVVSSFRTYFT